jgi:molybdate/tungstate transport system substrate-binding protein
LPTVSTKPIDKAATYTVTVLKNAPHREAAVDFVHFLLGKKGTAILDDAGFELVDPARLTGDDKDVPALLRGQVDTG